MNRKKRTLFRSAVIGVTAIATSLTIGISTACSKGGSSSSSDSEEDKTTTKIDSQTIKNGNFEFYSDNKGLYPISSPDNWSSGSNGNSSAAMSGIIDTGKEHWDYITDPDLPKTLEDNDDLESSDKNKKDYNGALTDDLPYKNTHTATDTDDDSENAKDYIENPYTHAYRYNAEGKVVDGEGNEVETYTDEDGNIFLDSEHKQPLETSVLMLHNYYRSNYNGNESYYNSSTTVSLEANTAAEISVWVKTTEMYFGANNVRTQVEFDRGAYLKVNTQVGGNSLDSFVIKNIDTEKLNPAPTTTVDGNEVIDYANWQNNGWVKYTVYVEASSFATTTVSVTLGLGQYEQNSVEGYAFFDDVSIKKYLNRADMETKTGFSTKIHEPANETDPDANVSYPLSPDAKTEFRVDKESYKTEDGAGGVKDQVYNNNFEDRDFFIDFASSASQGSSVVALNTTNVKAGLTVEDTSTGKYACTEYNATNNAYKTNGLGAISTDKPYVPNTLRKNPININDDILATTTVTSGEWTFDDIDTVYSTILTEALKTAVDLPATGADGSTDALVMLSARGAAYEAHITDESFKLADGEHMLVSFWIKTSDMDGNTAATVTVAGVGEEDKDNKSSFTVDSTAQSTVTIGEGDDKKEDVYNGWVRCFVRVANTSKSATDKQFKLIVNFGNTSIRSATRSAFKSGWVVMTSPTVMKLDEDVYSYTSGSSLTATLSFTETEEKTSHQFDTELSDRNEIKTDLATPSSYTGVNGKSQFVNSSNTVTLDGYDDANKNDYAGLLSKENFANYKKLYDENNSNCMWYNALQTIANVSGTSDELWDAVFGEYTVQPLLIVNSVRTFTNKESNAAEQKRYNYGYIGNSSSVSANGYKAISVRVKASEGAIANVYLVEDKTGGDVLAYSTPKYNFWYDADGNILKGEPDKDATTAEQKDNIAYTLRKDGLYENGDGKLYANIYNLTRQYDLSFEHESFFDESGAPVRFEDLVKGEIYYANAQKSAFAPHYLIAGGKDNNKVYMYSGEGVDNPTYYYVENGKANKNKVVHGIDVSVAPLRYDNSEADSTPYHFEIDTTKNPEYADKWITVTFYVHAGSQAKNYKLELWSGARDEISSYESAAKDSYVVFDYSDLSASLSQTTYDELVNKYSTDIIEEYKKVIPEFEDNDANISDLEKLASNKVDRYGYEASYYTFSLFDSEAFIPFNGETDKSGTGYSFDYSESKESLAYLKVVDNGLTDDSVTDGAIYTMSSFIDYSVLDKDIEIIGEPTAPDNNNNNSSTTSHTDTVNMWLLASSIVLVVAIFVAIAAIFIRDFIKKRKHKTTSGKNSYNFNKNKRYVKKYVKANGEAPEIAEDDVDESLLSDDKADETVTEESAVEATAEEAVDEGSETAANAEEQPEETADGDTPSEQESDTPSDTAEDKPEDDGKNE